MIFLVVILIVRWRVVVIVFFVVWLMIRRLFIIAVLVRLLFLSHVMLASLIEIVVGFTRLLDRALLRTTAAEAVVVGQHDE